MGYSPWGRKESDMTERLAVSLSGTLEGASQVVLVIRSLSASAEDVRDAGSIPGLGRSPRGGNGNPLQYSCLENPMDRGAWWATVQRVAKSQTQLKQPRLEG